jgi:hypothetical protein
VTITLQNSDRASHESGYGRINSYLARLVADSLDDDAADVHLYCSPPYAFYPHANTTVVPEMISRVDGVTLDSSKFHVGLTACDRPLTTYGNFDFARLCTRMNLLLVPSDWDRQMFRAAGLTVPIEVVRLGHNHADWACPVRNRQNTRVFVLDRGRDLSEESRRVLARYFEIDYYRCSGHGKLSRAELKKRYDRADIFFKWAEEGAWSYPVMEAMSAGCLVITNCAYTPLNAYNSFRFRSREELSQILQLCRGQDHMLLKQTAQLTAQQWSEELSASDIRQAIAKHRTI